MSDEKIKKSFLPMLWFASESASHAATHSNRGASVQERNLSVGNFSQGRFIIIQLNMQRSDKKQRIIIAFYIQSVPVSFSAPSGVEVWDA